MSWQAWLEASRVQISTHYGTTSVEASDKIDVIMMLFWIVMVMQITVMQADEDLLVHCPWYTSTQAGVAAPGKNKCIQLAVSTP
jgi:hypothetical protein